MYRKLSAGWASAGIVGEEGVEKDREEKGVSR